MNGRAGMRFPLARLLGALLVLVGGSVALGQPLPGAELQQAIEAVVASPETQFQAGVLAVRRPGGETWAGAAGVNELESGAPLAPEARFRAGSIAKTFVATVVLQLVEEGAFGLDDPAAGLLPEDVVSMFEGAEGITVRMLLNHTSGLPEWSTEEFDRVIAEDFERVWEAREFLEAAAGSPRSFAPGESWEYSNTNYNLLGLIVEGATGNDWREEVTARLIEPLGLGSTSLPAPGDTSLTEPYMYGYHPLGGELIDISHLDPSMAGAAGGGALVTNTLDLITFMEALLSGALFQEPATLEEMMGFVDAEYPGGQTGYGLGLQRSVISGAPAIGNAGGTAGYLSYVGYLPELDVFIAGSVDAQVDPTPLFAAAIEVLEEWSSP